MSHAAATGLGWVEPAEIDQYGLSNALKLATRRAVKQVLATNVKFDEIIIDGTINFLTDTPLEDRVTLLKKADFLVKEVSAASIIAKVARDNYMTKIAQTYPMYYFEKNVGYGTAAHQQALIEHGVCPEHRRSFKPIREIISRFESNSSSAILSSAPNLPNPSTSNALDISNTSNALSRSNASNTPNRHQSNPSASNPTVKGQAAEVAVMNHLEAKGHTIIAHNFKTKTYEIDLISTKDDTIYFTEVKYRKASHSGTPLEQITPKKLQQMRYAAELFLAQHPQFAKLTPQLAAAAVSGEDYTLEAWLNIS